MKLTTTMQKLMKDPLFPFRYDKLLQYTKSQEHTSSSTVIDLREILKVCGAKDCIMALQAAKQYRNMGFNQICWAMSIELGMIAVADFEQGVGGENSPRLAIETMLDLHGRTGAFTGPSGSKLREDLYAAVAKACEANPYWDATLDIDENWCTKWVENPAWGVHFMSDWVERVFQEIPLACGMTTRLMEYKIKRREILNKYID